MCLRRRRTADEEPLVDAGVDWSGALVLALRDVDRAGVGAVLRVLDSGVGAVMLSVAVREKERTKHTERCHPWRSCQ